MTHPHALMPYTPGDRGPGTPASPLRVFVVDDSAVVRFKLRELLARPEFEMVGEAPDGATALELIAHAIPDVVVMDLQMPGMSGIDATWRLGAVAPAARILMLTVSDDENDVADAVMAGASGYVLKGSPDAEIQDAVRHVASGESVISPAVAGALVRRGTETVEPTRADEPVKAFVEELPAQAAVPVSVPPPVPDTYGPAGAPEVSALLSGGAILVAGLLLTALGQGAAITDGDASVGLWLRVALNFLIVYAVWHAGVVAAGRRAPITWGRRRREDMDRAPAFE